MVAKATNQGLKAQINGIKVGKKYLIKPRKKLKRKSKMKTRTLTGIEHIKKCTSQGTGGRGRGVKISTSHMNKSKKRSYKAYKGQGR